jgi:hypothetical protein
MLLHTGGRLLGTGLVRTMLIRTGTLRTVQVETHVPLAPLAGGLVLLAIHSSETHYERHTNAELTTLIRRKGQCATRWPT